MSAVPPTMNTPGEPTTATQSIESSLTHVSITEKAQQPQHFAEGHGESALPEDKITEAIENLEDDWENDPDNPRNWSPSRKWTAVSVVRLRANAAGRV